MDEQDQETSRREKLKRLISKFGAKNQDLARKGSNRNATVAWMVSNCLTESNREGYVEKLQEFIDVDIYGGCYDDSLECGKDDVQGCWDRIAKEYKFYLAFENSIARTMSQRSSLIPFKGASYPLSWSVLIIPR